MKTTRYIALAAAALFVAAFWTDVGCSGEKKPATLEEGLLDYSNVDVVKFSISGVASCSSCIRDEVPVIGIQIEVLPKGDPLHSIGLYSFEGLGPFTIKDIKSEKGRPLEISGTLYLEGSAEPNTINGYAEVVVPGDDGDVVAVTINFPSTANN